MAEDTRAYVANFHPLVGHLIQQTGLVPLLTELLDDPDQEYTVDAGTVVAGLIHNLLSSEPLRLYRLAEFWADKPLPLLFPWQPGLSAEAINEDRAGRVLDAWHRAGPQKVFSAVLRQVMAQYTLDVQHIHYDTTAKSFYGIYAQQTAAQGPQLARGHSKDHRPDLVQLLFGVTMSRDGVLVAGEVSSGNEPDMTANGYWITQVRQQLGRDLDQFLLYVADCALVTEENLCLLRLFHLALISRLPERFGLAEELFAQALAPGSTWTEVGPLGQGKRAARYQVWETTAPLAGATYRFLVVRSDHLTAQQTRTLERTLAREQALHKALTKLAHQRWDTLAEAEKAQALWTQAHPLRYHQVQWTITPQTQYLPRATPGRPRQDEDRPTVTRYPVSGVLLPNAAVIQAARARCGLFIVLTSLLDQTAWPAGTILSEYKEQHLPERLHRFLKSPLVVGAFCLKRPERIIALGYLLLLAAMIYTLLERQVRQALQEATEPPVQGLDHRPTRRPTTWAIFTALGGITIVAERAGDLWHLRPSRPLSTNQSRLLTLAGFGPAIYSWQGELSTIRSRAPT